MEKILVIGAAGQLGSELTKALTDRFGSEHVIATDLNAEAKEKFDFCRFQVLDIMDQESVRSLVKNEKITQIYHLAAVLCPLQLDAKPGRSPQGARTCMNSVFTSGRFFWPPTSSLPCCPSTGWST